MSAGIPLMENRVVNGVAELQSQQQPIVGVVWYVPE